MSKDEYRLINEADGTLTVVMSTETRPPSPEPPSSPCPSQHLITPLGEKEGWQGREGKEAIVRAVHNCSPLNAAVIMNNQEKVAEILSTDVSTDEFLHLDCSGSPPICEAAYHNHIKIMHLLLDSPRVDVNTTNHLGLSPLCIAANNTLDNPKMTEILLQKNADVNVRAKDGRSALHIAAEGGRYRIVRRLLGARNLQDGILLHSYSDGEIFCPPPVILAAANEQENVVDQLLKHVSHPPGIIRDTKLLLWARNTLTTAIIGRHVYNDELAIAAVQMERGALSHRSLPIPAYNNVKEISSVEEIETLSSLPSPEGVCMRLFQCLTILEHNVGLSNKLVSTCIGMAINVFKMFSKHDIIVKLLLRIFEGISLMECLILSRGFSMMPSHLHVTLSFFLIQFWKRVRELTEAKYSIGFLPFVVGLSSDIDIILSLKEQQPCRKVDHWGEAFQTDFTHLLALTACALLSIKSSSNSDRYSLGEIGHQMVSKYEMYAADNFTSLVHLALRKAGGITEILKCSGIGGKNAMVSYSLLVEALLHWGCSKYLNVPYKHYFCKGELPLHMAVRLAEMDPCYLQVVEILLCHGSHYDGVASSGLIPSKLATRDHLKACFDLSPLPLACLTSKAIIDYDLSYQTTLYLPPVIKHFIAYHDPSFMN